MFSRKLSFPMQRKGTQFKEKLAFFMELLAYRRKVFSMLIFLTSKTIKFRGFCLRYSSLNSARLFCKSMPDQYDPKSRMKLRVIITRTP